MCIDIRLYLEGRMNKFPDSKLKFYWHYVDYIWAKLISRESTSDGGGRLRVRLFVTCCPTREHVSASGE